MNPKYLPQISSQGGSALGLATLAFEKHYRVRELARLWGLSAKTVTRMFVEEAGVIRVANDGTAKRKYATLSIPECAFPKGSRETRQPDAPGDACGRPPTSHNTSR